MIPIRLAVVAGLVAVAAPAQATRVLTRKSDGRRGEISLNVSGGRGFEISTISLFCDPGRGEYVLVLVAPELGPPTGDADVALRAGSATLGTHRFVRQNESLMLIADGPPGRSLVNRASAAPLVAATVAGRRITFALSAGAAQVARFRQSCGLKP
ncbi:hypothetical protein [uncultured Methylobacterium sp.]|jgi:hypothetical protein|uniref:hypothetical protein n=1 Tax=uncultured Methylobacterium sp. TaxID=157278 RepID=UPI00261E5D7C|nr:hypothetical protein [uncultured Methylobacterium sp.]